MNNCKLYIIFHENRLWIMFDQCAVRSYQRLTSGDDLTWHNDLIEMKYGAFIRGLYID